MFSVLLSYVTLQDVVHLCSDNEACNPAFHMCGNALQSDQHSFLQPVFRGNMPFTPSVRSHFPVRWRAFFSSIEIFVPSLIRLGLNLRNLAYPSLFSGRD